MANINDVLGGHVALEIECVDRLYLNAYVPRLRVGGQVVWFLREHLGAEIPSPALLGRVGTRLRGEVKRFAKDRGIPILQLKTWRPAGAKLGQGRRRPPPTRDIDELDR